MLVWIHGGGYGQGQGNQDLSSIINTNNDAFIGVAIQYRVSQVPMMGIFRKLKMAAWRFRIPIVRRSYALRRPECRYTRSNICAAMGAELHPSVWWQCFPGHHLGRERRRYVIRGCNIATNLLTIGSAGGAVMLQTLAFGGYLSDSLFKNVGNCIQA